MLPTPSAVRSGRSSLHNLGALDDMSLPTHLRFRARGTACVPNHDLEILRIKSFIGRRLGPVPEMPGTFGFIPTGEDDVVPFRFEYVKRCKDGELWPADEATAKACGVPFDPLFGEPPKPAAAPTKKTDDKADSSAGKG